MNQKREQSEEAQAPLADDAICEACGHLGRWHCRHVHNAQWLGCMVSVDSAFTVDNTRGCGCSRLRAP